MGDYDYTLETLAVIAVVGCLCAIVYQAVKPSPKEEFDQSLAKLAKSFAFAYKAALDGATFSLIRNIPSLIRLNPKLYSAMKGNHRGVEINHFSLALLPERPKTSCIAIPLQETSIPDFQLIQKDFYEPLSRVFALESEVYTYKVPAVDGTHFLFTGAEKETVKLLNKVFQHNLDLLTRFCFIVENNYLLIFDYEKTLQVSELGKVFRHSVGVYEVMMLPADDVNGDTILSLQPDYCVEPYYPYGTEYLKLANELGFGHADFWKLEQTTYLDGLPFLWKYIKRLPYDDEEFYPATNLIWGKCQELNVYLADRSMPDWFDFNRKRRGSGSTLYAYGGSSLDLEKLYTFCIVIHQDKYIPPFTLIPKHEVRHYKLADEDMMNFDGDKKFMSQYQLMTSHAYAVEKIFNEDLRKLLLDQAITLECVGDRTAIQL